MGKLKILVADDDKTFRLLYDKALSQDGLETKIVENGEEAVEEYKTWKPDIMVLDITMPVKSGYAALKEIRGLEKDKKEKTTIIMATGMSDKDDIMDCLKQGIQGYIVKPFKYSEVAGKILAAYKKARPEEKT